MPILTRLFPSSDELTALKRILRRVPDQRTIERIHFERRSMRLCCYGTFLCFSLFCGFTVAMFVRDALDYQDPAWMWFLVLVPTVVFALQFSLMVHVEHLYRKVGL